MANLQHLKASRTKILNTFPTNTLGKDGDLVISRITGKGVYLCSKAGGIWYTANKMEELRKTGLLSTDKISAKQISINNLANSTKNNDKFLVSESSIITYRTGEQVVDDLDIKIRDINYKTAYCSLGQHIDKNSCEKAGGTWYYSENDSHDSISSTAENQLLTVGQSIGKLDVESTLLYDGSTLEIKRNPNYDDNWQTSTQTDLLKLTYDSNYSGNIGISSTGNMTFTVGDDKSFYFLDGVGQTRCVINSETGILKINAPDSALNSFSIDVDSSSVTTIKTTDFSGAAAHLTLVPDGDLVLDPASKKTIINESIVFNTQTHQNITSGGIAIDWNNGNKQSIDITGTGYTLTMTNPAGPCNLILKVIQGDGNDTITTWAASSGSVYWSGGAIPTLSTGNGEIDIISFYFDGTNYFAVASLDFATV